MLPGVLTILTPIIVGLVMGAEALGAYMAGVTVSGVMWAIFQNNAGGAWDNAKKSFEKGVDIGGQTYYKKSEPHKAAVVGDTVGDPFKDTSGPSMNILIKLTCLVGLTLAPLLAKEHMPVSKADSAIESTMNSALEIKETTWAAHTYIADRAIVDIKDLGQVFQDKTPKLFEYIQQNKIEPFEPVSALFYTWDTAAGKTDLAIAIPVKDASKVSGSYTAITVDSSKAIMIDFYGPYEKTGLAHDALKKYIHEKGLKMKGPAIEEYITDPSTEKDPNKVLTKVYYLIEG